MSKPLHSYAWAPETLAAEYIYFGHTEDLKVIINHKLPVAIPYYHTFPDSGTILLSKADVTEIARYPPKSFLLPGTQYTIYIF